MKPQEILGMVEEAAGTRMFEDRKDKAKKTMAKKEKRVLEITATLYEDIAPKLEKLRAEKREYLEYQKAVTELERVGKVISAFKWTEMNSQVEKKIKDKERKEGEITQMKQNKKRLAAEVTEAEKEHASVVKKRDAEMQKGGKLGKLEAEVSELDKELTKVKTQEEIKEGSIKEEEKNIEVAEQTIREVRTTL